MTSHELRELTARELVSALERDGFALRRTHGSHRVYRHSNGRRVIIAMHSPGETFPAKTLASIVQSAGWSGSDLRRLELL
jgi:predicted RNA binding protein YcfA (HicA-like mRNA interferase family)